MECKYCGFELNNGQTICPNCGGPVENYSEYNIPSQKHKTSRVCSRAVYVWCAILFGTLGIHDFYAGYCLRGILKIILTLLGLGLFISIPWAILDAFIVKKTRTGQMFV